MKTIIGVCLVASAFGFGYPSDFVLVEPDSVKRTTNQEIEVVFQVPCKSLDWDTIVTSSDDSGDRIVVVGIAYPKSHCKTANASVVHSRRITRDWPEWETLQIPDTDLKPMKASKP